VGHHRPGQGRAQRLALQRGPAPRVRIPELCCDFSADGTEGLRFTDQYDAWNGTTERYTWKLVGKKEMYIPYNVFKLSDKSLKAADVLKPGNVNPDPLRYDAPRVGRRGHAQGRQAPRDRQARCTSTRTPSRLAADLYDSRGQLWRFQETYAMQYYDVNVPWYSGMSFYDLNSGVHARLRELRGQGSAGLRRARQAGRLPAGRCAGMGTK
jgi:hypothetical protein